MRTLNSGLKKKHFSVKLTFFKHKRTYDVKWVEPITLYSDLLGNISQNIFHVFLFFCTYTNWKAKAVFNNLFCQDAFPSDFMTLAMARTQFCNSSLS